MWLHPRAGLHDGAAGVLDFHALCRGHPHYDRGDCAITAAAGRIMDDVGRYGNYFVALIFFGVGHCAVIVAAGSSTEMVQRFLNWNERSKGLTIVKGGCGVLVILGGVWLIYTMP